MQILSVSNQLKYFSFLLNDKQRNVDKADKIVTVCFMTDIREIQLSFFLLELQLFINIYHSLNHKNLFVSSSSPRLFDV